MKRSRYIMLMLVVLFTMVNEVVAQNKFELVHFTTGDGGKIEAAYFKANKDKVVVFAHGAIFNKESWYFLAENFQKKGIAALSIDFGGYGNSTAGSTHKKMYDILGAITYLRNQGFDEISVIGGSMGGAAVLSALAELKTPINNVVLLAPAGGPPITSGTTDKLFIVSKKEGLYNSVKSIFEASENPKEIKEYSGNAHAQHMFKEAYSDELSTLIIDFIISHK